ncbi:MAG: hypothetical protein WCB85_01280 [Candidatus Dormiibacterota bacterium]
MATIEVSPERGSGFRVRVEGRSFAVTVAEPLVAELGAADAETLIRAAFEFLLEREPAGSILPRFDLEVIGRYFPEWRDEIRQRLG